MRTVGFIPECTPLSSVPPSSEEQGQKEEQEQEEEQPKKGRVKNGDKR